MTSKDKKEYYSILSSSSSLSLSCIGLITFIGLKILK